MAPPFKVRTDLVVFPKMGTPVERALEKKRIRRHLILDRMRAHGPLSRAEVTRRLGFNSQTVKSLVGELVADGLLIEEPEEREGAMGRPPTPCRLNRRAAMVLGIHLGEGRASAMTLDLGGEELASHSAALPPGASTMEQAAAVVAFAVRALSAARSKPPPLAGIGLGVPDSVALECSGQHGFMVPPPQSLAAQAARALQLEFGVPVLVNSDSRLSALASHWFGAGRRFGSFCWLGIGEGVSLVLVQDGRIQLGALGRAGSLADVPLAPSDGAKRAPTMGAALSLRPLAESLGESEVAAALAKLSRGGNGVRTLPTDYTARLAQAIATVACLANPEAVIIGGPLARHPGLFEGRLRELLPCCLPEDLLVRTEFEVCPVSASDEALGAATLVLHHIFSPIQVNVEDVL